MRDPFVLLLAFAVIVFAVAGGIALSPYIFFLLLLLIVIFALERR